MEVEEEIDLAPCTIPLYPFSGACDATETMYIKALTEAIPFDVRKHLTHIPIPPILLEDICRHLADDGAKKTLASILILSRRSYDIVTPLIYEGTLIVSRRGQGVFPTRILDKSELASDYLMGRKVDASYLALRRMDSAIVVSRSLRQLKNICGMKKPLCIRSWPAESQSEPWAELVKKYWFAWKIRMIKIEATAIMSDGGSLSECRAFLRSLRPILHQDLEVCLYLPVGSSIGASFDRADMCCTVLTSAKRITFHDCCAQALPFGQVGITHYRYFLLPYPTSSSSKKRSNQIADLYQEIKSSSLATFTTPQGSYRIPAQIRLEFHDAGAHGDLWTHLNDAQKRTLVSRSGFGRVMKKRSFANPSIERKRTVLADGRIAMVPVCLCCEAMGIA